MRTTVLSTYPAVHALQWIDGVGAYCQTREGWHAIRPVIVAEDARPWPERTPWPSVDNYCPELELMLQ